MVTSPKLLFLDEPTSGLDAFNAFNVMETIKNVAVANQMVILCTIHQPRTELLELFNSLILLSAGKTVYFGPLTGALDHFETLGYILPPKTNPSDFFLDIITPDLRSEDQRTTSYNRIDKFKKEWQQVETTDSPLPQTYSDIKVSGLNSWFLEFYVLLERNLIDVSRDVPTLGATIGQGLFIMLLMGFLFFKVNLEPAGVQYFHFNIETVSVYCSLFALIKRLAWLCRLLPCFL